MVLRDQRVCGGYGKIPLVWNLPPIHSTRVAAVKGLSRHMLPAGKDGRSAIPRFP